ncbi:MAG: helix-turn-helix domain-containing protein [Bdellovibrionales bacterium]
MNDHEPIVIVEEDQRVVSQVRAMLERHVLQGDVKFSGDTHGHDGFLAIHLSRPVRLGAVLDRIYNLQSKNQFIDRIDLGNGRICDTHLGLYYANQDADPIRLTEKEVDLLKALASMKGECISRDRLLNEVWQYAEGLETHTLETHIYRLRQKIEDDPSDPQILKINDDGYYLSFE